MIMSTLAEGGGGGGYWDWWQMMTRGGGGGVKTLAKIWWRYMWTIPYWFSKNVLYYSWHVLYVKVAMMEQSSFLPQIHTPPLYWSVVSFRGHVIFSFNDTAALVFKMVKANRHFKRAVWFFEPLRESAIRNAFKRLGKNDQDFYSIGHFCLG